MASAPHHVHLRDLPDGLDLGPIVAVDCETMGLQIGRDRLCVVQLSAGDGVAHLVRLDPPGPDGRIAAPHLARLLVDPARLKLLHFARFDVAAAQRYLGVLMAPIYCTKIASRLARTYTDRHGLKDVARELLGIELNKDQQSSDWGAPELTDKQIAYAAADVLHLHALRERLNAMLAREGRAALAQACFDFLPHRALLDLGGWPEDVFAH